MALFFAALPAFMWMVTHGAEITLNAEGVFHSKWKRSLLFKDVTKIVATQRNGHFIFVFHLKEKTLPLGKYNIFGFSTKLVSLGLTGFGEKPPVIGQTIYRYFTRQIE